MNIKLIKGHFSAADSLELIDNIIRQKIKFQENKIQQNSSEEDIKMREKRIKELQDNLAELRVYLNNSSNNITLDCSIHIS